ncbi:zinc finger CCCH-type with G patch domain-containing protein [Gadus chalcogrammus]|uniref:zinc finger CCCH-type with G patch domain-containing protein n=1 Tax=Gadus chalcogrammus TaxID=1042646 RepID=UPI0024C30D21|nr:zinc finger CCCH-type with G patch domain-containing protein [Gadus chalcogrammus]
MDEESLEAGITAYRAQLQQVDTALSAGLDPSHQADLLQLREDLAQLIELTEASLISVKKSQLLASLEETTGGGVAKPGGEHEANGGFDHEFAAFYSELEGPSGSSAGGRVNGEEEEEEEEEENGHDDDGGGDEEDGAADTLSGTKVQAPYRTTWGTLEYHNAMVVGREAPDGDEAQVRVLYVYPTHKSLKPCPFFLEDKCRFETNCRFSHGEVVYVSELRPFLELDLSHLLEGSACRARHEDGIWYPARILEIDNGFYTVKFDSLLLKDAVVEGDGVIPPMREDDLSSSDSSDQDDDEDSIFAKVVQAHAGDPTTTSSADFGGWEAHTRGIGSRLMLKMGYEYGKGLGKQQEGRVEPVMAVVLPKGASLDQSAELSQPRAARRGPRPGDGPQPGPKRKRAPRPRAPGGRRNVFDFLNRKLGDGGAEGASASPTPGAEAYRGGEGAKRSLNVRLFQAAERVSQTEREIQRITEALRKRAGRDVCVVKRLEEQLGAARSQLVCLKAQEQSVQTQHRKADTHKKMTQF